ncbi:uncharacterized protein B0T15DRAFT_553400 [Chaetomium strumarium]|uniref:MOSC domain-containing protein n=1 Tax=Chaetomium strumarium TaxID=1170767 RepID=A0AAJ0GVR2_9PEZI|nr:hypothetical protein B0T15DRAFT_553400 [Chaetomium strumarium]
MTSAHVRYGAFLLIITILLFFVPLLTFFPPVPPSKRDALLETHTQIGLRPARTGLTGQQQGAAASSNGAKGGESSSGKISSLWIYPLKSCRGIEVSQSKVLPTGLEFDRIYTFAQLKSAFPVDVHSAGEKEAPSSHSGSWHFITQRQFPLLATVQAELFVPDIIKARGQSSKVAEPFLLVRFPWQEPGLRGLVSWAAAKIARGWSARPEKEFLLPVAFPSREDIAALGYAYEDVTIWRDTVTALNLEAELPRELGLYLGVSNRLGIFRIDPDRLRNVYRCAPTKDEAGYQPVTGFQDAYPLHLLNLTSVRDFDAKIDKDDTLPALDPRRFRANIIVDGGDAPYDEDTWRKIRFIPGPGSRREASTFHVSCRTVRCKMPNVDQDTGYRHPVEPDRSLRKYRDVDEGATSMGCLGMQLTPLYSKTSSEEGLESWVEVGMSVEVLDRGSHVYIRQ